MSLYVVYHKTWIGEGLSRARLDRVALSTDDLKEAQETAGRLDSQSMLAGTSAYIVEVPDRRAREYRKRKSR
jgi:hypothetical protein